MFRAELVAQADLLFPEDILQNRSAFPLMHKHFIWLTVCVFAFSFVFMCLFPQVSFYRGEVPSDLPEEVARKRKGPDSQWMATLPLRLPVRFIDEMNVC